MGVARRNAFVPRGVKSRGKKAVRNYTTNPRKATKYDGFRTTIGRHTNGMSKYRFTGRAGEVLKGTWVYVNTAHRTFKSGKNQVLARMFRLSDGRKMTVLFANGTGVNARKVSVIDVYAGW